jgi:hypothetical protein
MRQSVMVIGAMICFKRPSVVGLRVDPRVDLRTQPTG